MEFRRPKIGAGPASGYKTRVSSARHPAGFFPGGAGRFFGDRPRGEEFAFAKWIGSLFFYYDGRFIADAAFPLVALNMVYGRRSAEQSGRIPRNRVEDAPQTHPKYMGGHRAGNVSFIDRIRHCGGGVRRGTDDYWADMSGDVAA